MIGEEEQVFFFFFFSFVWWFLHLFSTLDSTKTQDSLVKFFDDLEGLSSQFPWTLQMSCPMCLARIEEVQDNDVKIQKYKIEDKDVERVSAAFAEVKEEPVLFNFFLIFSFFLFQKIAFDAADLAEEEEAAKNK
jgi:uncharacterized protein YggL (DUF469 family)